MICPSCGKEIENSSKFCEFCGAKIEAAPAQKEAPTSPQKRKIPIIILSVLLLISLGFNVFQQIQLHASYQDSQVEGILKDPYYSKVLRTNDTLSQYLSSVRAKPNYLGTLEACNIIFLRKDTERRILLDNMVTDSSSVSNSDPDVVFAETLLSYDYRNYQYSSTLVLIGKSAGVSMVMSYLIIVYE